MPRSRPDRVAPAWIVLLLASAALPAVARAATPADPASAPKARHWSFVPPTRPDVPTVRDAAWVRNPVDAFIAAGLESVDLAPAPEADRTTLIRRVTFDLTGLPPRPDEIADFLDDHRPDAYERLVDRLLASPGYGERRARAWLDLARFAESDGFKSDKTRPDAWRYRDWVAQAFNDDMPYDRFIRLQLAGDEVEPGNPDAFVATGFNRNWPFEDNNKVPGQNRQIMLDDVTDTTASVFLGLTVGCARCHDHKYDPIRQEEYYRLQAVFSGIGAKDNFGLADPAGQALAASTEAEDSARIDRARREIETLERPYAARLLEGKLAKMPADVRRAFDTDPVQRSAFQDDLLIKQGKAIAVEPDALRAAMTPADRATWESRGETLGALRAASPAPLPTASGMTELAGAAPPTFLLRKGNMANPGAEVVPGYPAVLGGSGLLDASPTPTATSGRRKALAEWLARPDHPLTARVMVNRLWQEHFGRGIVATPGDFGTQGTEPTHPELLDWLATELVGQGWGLKAIHRMLVTSSTYRQSSLPPATTLADDPENVLLGRMPRRRLEAEAVRDALLAAAGRLDRRVGGPSVFPDLPPGVETRGGWTRSESAADRDRRSLYVFARRNLKYPLFDAFDAPDSNLTCSERTVSVNAPQALMLLNSELVLDLARSLADRARAEAGPDADADRLVDRAHRLALGRPPDAGELALAVAGLGADREQGLVDYCHVLFNLNEFVFVD